jgi:hypothetical protein
MARVLPCKHCGVMQLRVLPWAAWTLDRLTHYNQCEAERDQNLRLYLCDDRLY